MDSECAVMLSSVPTSQNDCSDNVDRLLNNWEFLSDKLKESNLVLDLLNILSGLDSSFFILSANPYTSKFDVEINPLLSKDIQEDVLEMCHEILQIRFDQCVLIHFVNQDHKSFICQTISSEFINILEELQECVSRFNDLHVKSFLGVKRLLNYLRPGKQTLSLLSTIVTDINSSSLLYDNSNLGVLILDSLELKCKNEVGFTKDLYQHLLNTCLESYLFLINHYLNNLTINDVVPDFFIKKKVEADPELQFNDHDSDRSSEFYSPSNLGFNLFLDYRYVPMFFKEVATKVFETGVYLKIMDKPLEYELAFTNLENLLSDLEKVYDLVSGDLFHILKTNHRLFDTFNGFFDFYLFQKSDFVYDVIEILNGKDDLDKLNNCLENFNGLVGTELSYFDRKTMDLSHSSGLPFQSKLHFELDNVNNLVGSIGFYNYYKSFSLKSDVYSHSFSDNLNSDDGGTGDDDHNIYEFQSAESFRFDDLDYRNLTLCCELDTFSRVIFTDEVLYKYKLLFKFLFQLKYAQHNLDQVSLYHMKTRQLAIEPDLAPVFNFQIFTMARMRYFTSVILQYYLLEVVSTKISEFLSVNHHDLSSLCSSHNKLLDSLLESFLFNEKDLFSTIQRMLLIIVKFTTEVENFVRNPTFSVTYFSFETEPDDFVNLAKFRSSVEINTDNLNTLLRNPGYCKMVSISRFEFDNNMKLLMSQLNKSPTPLRDRFNNPM